MAANGRVRQAQEVESALLARIQTGQDVDGRLPSETDLATQFGVSRVTVREALSSLERQGLVIRKQGLGTFINRKTAEIQTRVEYSELIRRAGYESAVAFLSFQKEAASEGLAERLLIEPGAPVLAIRKVFTANGRPVIYCINAIPLALVSPERGVALVKEIVPKLSIYTLLARWFDQRVMYQVAHVTASLATSEIARGLNCRAGCPLLLIADVGYNDRQRPLFAGDSYYVPDKIHFRLVRKPIYEIQDLP